MKKTYMHPYTTTEVVSIYQFMKVGSIPVNDDEEDEDVDDHDVLLIKPREEDWSTPPTSSLWEEW